LILFRFSKTKNSLLFKQQTLLLQRTLEKHQFTDYETLDVLFEEESIVAFVTDWYF